MAENKNIYGKTYSQAEANAANLIARTFAEETRRHQARFSGPGAQPQPHRKFKDVFGDMHKHQTVNGAEAVRKAAADDANVRAKLLLKAARLCLENNYDPVLFVQRQFATLVAGDRPLPLSWLAGPEAARNYRAFDAAGERDTLKVVKKSQNALFDLAARMLLMSPMPLTREQSWARVLLDPTAELSALFRFCMARSIAAAPATVDSERFIRIALTFAGRAASQFVVAAESYTAAWGDFIPADFIASAKPAHLQNLAAFSEGATDGNA